MFRRAVVPAALAIVLPLLVTVGVSGSTATASPQATSATAGAFLRQADEPQPAARRLRKWAPRRVTPRGGPSFNNPYGTVAEQRTNLDRFIKIVDSTRGYKVDRVSQCPKRRRNWPNNIRLALYSFSDPRSADALIRAHRRCINVQVLMNDHLTNRDVPAFGRLQRVLGTRKGNRSWARRCDNGCRGPSGPLHSKILLIDKVRKARQVVMIGSSNLTGKAAYVQWNDFYVFKDRDELFDQYNLIFEEMKRDRRAPDPLERNYTAGRVKSMFWPQPGHTKRTDRVLDVLRKVDCQATPTDGRGYAGRTGVAVHIHAMEGDRGYYIARKIVRMHNQGCRVRVLYGLIAPRINTRFKEGDVPRRRTIFDRDENGLAEAYTHMKVVAINGVYDGDTSARVVWTGSENFSHRTVGADEVWVQVPWSRHWRKYQGLFDMIWRSDLYSDPRYAHYSQSDTPIHARQRPPEEGVIYVDGEDLELG